MQPVVRLRSVVCLLDRFPALAGADLDVHEREVLLLSGPNGAGKTTLLRLIAGLVPLRSGEAEVLGTDLAHDRRSMRRRLALVHVEVDAGERREAIEEADDGAKTDNGLHRASLE